MKDDLVDPVCRDVGEPGNMSEDAEMLDLVELADTQPLNINPEKFAMGATGTWDATTNW